MENEEYSDPYPSVQFVDEVKKDVIVATCFRCGLSWKPKTVNGLIKSYPKNCRHCNSPYWNKPRAERGEAKSVNKYGFNEMELNKWYLWPWFLLPNGGMDGARNESRWRSFAQFARRRGLLTRDDSSKGKMYVMLIPDPSKI